jgi:hypothetical protein
MHHPIKELNTDLLVVGGGLAGTIAAIAAKRCSPTLEVWLVERYGFLGGMATAGYVFPMMRYFTRDPLTLKTKRLTGGLFQELMDRMHQLGYTERFGEFFSRFDPMMMRCVLDTMCLENNVNLLFHGLVNRVEIENGSNQSKSISKVIVQTKKGEVHFSPKWLVDATGDADIVFHAGGKWHMGREEDDLVQPGTLNFRMGNISLLEPVRSQISRKMKKEKANGNPLTPRNDCLMFTSNNAHERHFNQTRVICDDFTDPFLFTNAELEGRQQAERYIRFLRNNFYGYRHASVVGLGTQLGVRETRRILGEYELHENDLLNCVLFPDRIALGNYSIDIHDPKGTASTDIRRIPEGKYYSIPFRCLIPQGISNIIVAGRPISATHVAHSAIRIMPICASLGHAAGVAVGILHRTNSQKSIKEVDIECLQNELRNQKAVLE